MKNKMFTSVHAKAKFKRIEKNQFNHKHINKNRFSMIATNTHFASVLHRKAIRDGREMNISNVVITAKHKRMSARLRKIAMQKKWLVTSYHDVLNYNYTIICKPVL